jgi:hypothetical protein
MTDSDDIPSEPPLQPVKNNAGWQRRLKITIAACAVGLMLVAAGQLWERLNHHPQIVYPPEALVELRQGERPVNEEYLRELLRTYRRDHPSPTCIVGKKYGALCQDGEVTFDGSEDACSDNGGVKEWIKCR